MALFASSLERLESVGIACIKGAHRWLHSMLPFSSIIHIVLMNATLDKPRKGGQH